MTASPAAARVLVASDNPSDAGQVVQQIGGEYAQLRTSTDPACAVADFEDFRPDVLVLAFDSIAKAQRYSLGLYRMSVVVGTHRHATVLLCAKDEVRTGFDLCKGGNFDDYVLHWPHAQDGQRLAMSIWNAARSVITLAAEPTRLELDRHAQQLATVDSLLRQELSEGETTLGGATRALQTAEQAVGVAIDEFGHRLTRPGCDAIVASKDKAALARELTRLTTESVSRAFATGAAAVAPIAAWPRQVQGRLQPHMAVMRSFAARIGEARRTLLVVDDDAFERKLIAKALEDQPFAIEFAEDGAAALRLLRRVRPVLILMDIRLPDLDGVALTRKLKAAPHLADIPVLMLTGDARRDTLASSIEAGAAGFIVKPFTRDVLLQHLSRVVSSDRSQA
jgi:CheY-like chemotaxis protein